MSEKIKPHHIGRKAILYVRHSSTFQLQNNLESQELQYAMRDRLCSLGWCDIEVIAEDLGRSAGGTVTRVGSERMVAEVCLGAGRRSGGERGLAFCAQQSRVAEAGGRENIAGSRQPDAPCACGCWQGGSRRRAGKCDCDLPRSGRARRKAGTDQRTRFSASIPHGPVWVHADAEALRRALLILIDNAAKYTPEGGSVRIKLSADDGFARFSVTDSGIGIAAADLPHIFNRFWRAHKAHSRSQGGAGLGLSIAKWIAETHAGSITVESESGKGSVFCLNVPVEKQC